MFFPNWRDFSFECEQRHLDKLAARNEEFSLLVRIAMELVGRSPEDQQKVGKYYERYANQAKFPDVRDLVISLLQLIS